MPKAGNGGSLALAEVDEVDAGLRGDQGVELVLDQLDLRACPLGVPDRLVNLKERTALVRRLREQLRDLKTCTTSDRKRHSAPDKLAHEVEYVTPMSHRTCGAGIALRNT